MSDSGGERHTPYEYESIDGASPNGELWITQMGHGGNDHVVVRIGYGGGGAVETLQHARRVIRDTQGPNALECGDLLVTLLDANGDTTDDDPLRVPAAQADWFLGMWLQVPAGWLATPEREATDDAV